MALIRLIDIRYTLNTPVPWLHLNLSCFCSVTHTYLVDVKVLFIPVPTGLFTLFFEFLSYDKPTSYVDYVLRTCLLAE